ncbi:hypothetical protein QQY24_11700 [Streptomyces sp. TG1A-8]|uniref:hypothetical protein n=1 Tax=Streptomyces sp. TG1A-8 TaxID=3051385 RepID=UPI00265BB71C|nr:hypothetical protein [Streptomyces sp. TG1A-8]MDO0926053.1 hypothetical protein [Streptomyces sp. TG1A-8]
MVRRPVAWVVAVVLLAEACGIAALNWFLAVVVDRQKMSLAGLDPDVMATSSKIGAVVFGLYFALCALVAATVAVRDRAPAGFGRVVLVSAAVVHALLGAFALSTVGPLAFVLMLVMLALIVLLLVTYDREGGPERATPGGPAQGGAPRAGTAPREAPRAADGPHSRRDEPRDGDDGPQDSVPAQVTESAPTTP